MYPFDYWLVKVLLSNDVELECLDSLEEYKKGVESGDEKEGIKMEKSMKFRSWYERGKRLQMENRMKEAMVCFDLAKKCAPDYHSFQMVEQEILRINGR